MFSGYRRLTESKTMQHPLRIVSLTLILLLVPCSWAQEFRATITGRVTDKSDAGIPQATVTVIHKSTNQTTIVTTNQEGYYTVPYLQPSSYDVEVSANGFARLKQQDVTLLTAQRLELPFRLEVGAVSESVTVEASAETLQTGDASGGLNFDSLQASEYALNGRQVYMLMDLTPGVLFTQEQFGQSGYSGTRGWDASDQYVMSGGVRAPTASASMAPRSASLVNGRLPPIWKRSRSSR